ncbi:ArsR family transcriptional regulator [Tsukamurella pulmonis]|uniref:DNA-binding transcriptional regulator, IclR family n=1 Tax=Tsukamurella pulmonis TaxID=47312 RepID=A0A1H1C444_9ACTN|nr:helix-turn-helix domain-containing protein [Tsukamurella pulmonis]KXO90070.1 ArsR family transcriptional regulator [Tsukamurella pulmonis]SDQ58945.1 DNA-binding transcriptional regulator, IclR family [Tsukamurella pulmonis]SUP24252.1 DNA-binding transcriptional regulator KdgR [Tsukamurella pulmonis]
MTEPTGVEAPPAAAGRTSPPTARVVAVLEFLSRHERERFGISELARRVGLSKPTCLGIVATLVESGYLLRDDRDKTYRLGPALIPLGRAARTSLREDPAGGDILAGLWEAFGHPASLSGVVGDRVTVLDVAVDPHRPAMVKVGDGYPFTPPIGLMYVLWDRTGRLERWLARDRVRADGDRLARVIETCRADGYLVELLTPAGQQLHRLMAGVPGDIPAELRAVLGEVVAGIGDRVHLRGDAAEPGESQNVSVISAPVFDGDGAQAMVASLYVSAELTEREIAERATSLIAAADRITVRIGGVKPGRAGR